MGTQRFAGSRGPLSFDCPVPALEGYKGRGSMSSPSSAQYGPCISGDGWESCCDGVMMEVPG